MYLRTKDVTVMRYTPLLTFRCASTFRPCTRFKDNRAEVSVRVPSGCMRHWLTRSASPSAMMVPRNEVEILENAQEV